MRRPPPAGTVFYYLADPDIAPQIADRGFAGSGIWNPQSTVTLHNRVPAASGEGVVLRISLTPHLAMAAVRREHSDSGAGLRKFLVPMEFLRHALVTSVRQVGHAWAAVDPPDQAGGPGPGRIRYF